MTGKLITDGYRKQNAALHRSRKSFGAKGHEWRDRVLELLIKFDAQTWLDYGCGKGQLVDSIVPSASASIVAFKYDPVTAPELPKPADFVTCCDVLEHVEPELLSNVLAHLSTLILGRGLFVISLRKSNKCLPDGRNAHLIIKSANWWLGQLSEHFSEVQVVDPIRPKRVGIELAVIVRP